MDIFHYEKNNKKTSNRQIRSKKTAKMFVASFLCVVMLFSMGAIYHKETKAATIKLSKTSLNIRRGRTYQFTLQNAKAAKVTWGSSNPFAGSITNGLFRANGYGKTKVTATYKKKTYTCKVFIPINERTLTLNKSKVTITDKSSFKLKPYAIGQVQYHSLNTHIATVTSKGKIKGKNPGTVTVVAKTGTAAAACKVKVKSAGDTAPTYAKWLYNKEKVAVRFFNRKGKAVYGPMITNKGKVLTVGLDNVKDSDVKKVVWSSSHKEYVTVAESGKTKATINALEVGSSKISAVIFYNSGKSEVLSNHIHVSNPTLNAKTLICFTKKAGTHRQQYVSFSGLNKYSSIKFSYKKTKKAKITQYSNKVKVFGKKKGKGTITAKVDGKTFKVKYYVMTPKFGSIIGVLAQGNTTKINISGIGNVQPTFTSRDPSVCSVALDGTITGRGSGVTYVDVKIGGMTFTYRVEVAAKGMKTIINRAKYIVNHWIYSQPKRMSDGYYDCSALVWKGYKAYNNYHARLGSTSYALPAAYLFDYLRAKGQIVSFGFTKLDDLRPGDLFFYGDYNSAVKYSQPGRTLNIYHVAMYAGNGRVVEKGTPKYTYNSLDHIVGVGRVVY